MMAITWGYILTMVISFFVKLVKKEREKKNTRTG